MTIFIPTGCSPMPRRSFKGFIVYIDPEHGWNMFIEPPRKDRILYIGVTDTSYVTANMGRPTWQHNIPLEAQFPLPAATLVMSLTKEKLQLLTSPPYQSPRRDRFLLFISSHCTDYRQASFDASVAYCKGHGLPPPTAAGNCHGTHPELNEVSGSEHGMNNELYRNYRFAFIFENTGVDGYITEKILDAVAGGAIPIYLGSPKAPIRFSLDTGQSPTEWEKKRPHFEAGSITNLFNADRILFWDLFYPEETLRKLEYLENNRTAYKEMQQLPILAHGRATEEEYFSLWPQFSNHTNGSLLKRLRQRIFHML
mmetsp:Transcript_10371/g.27311  ORF Transcript_10371/g.27311 Transcript_10371/m.27311 type:complete len:311 (+) Transcript_10371:658-1590(+)|eukprot:CAMPEP_0119538510 /NCGR_PEP_ID=MMETSP1344-20130328/50912_1 /TAXON_ID=236787 /ORGANISM="Florenciella parvula, Strain CCMP2471" /LENGTH=310 /DNA_ID=CAMNT_0007581433 /DNA_START=655 /DNA_END=1587 /DNA_ORIENTATION=-